MAPHLHNVVEELGRDEWNVPEIAVFFAGDEVQRWAAETGDLPKWLRTHTAKGGRDNVPALLAAWDFAAEEPGGAIVWIHGPQPVLLTGTEALLQRTERDRHRPVIYDLPLHLVRTAFWMNSAIFQSCGLPMWKQISALRFGLFQESC
jgi:hypothetical protein